MRRIPYRLCSIYCTSIKDDFDVLYIDLGMHCTLGTGPQGVERDVRRSRIVDTLQATGDLNFTLRLQLKRKERKERKGQKSIKNSLRKIG